MRTYGKSGLAQFCFLTLISIVLFLANTETEAAKPVQTNTKTNLSLALQAYNNGIYSINMPKGWKIITAGDGSTLAFLTWDPSHPQRQIFYFGAVGPLYMSARQKQIDVNYMNSGGYPIGWIEMPVIEPFTPSNFLSQFSQIARTNVARNFMPQCPKLDRFQIISAKPQPSMLPGGQTELIRAIFVQDGRLAEGLFIATMVPFTPFMNGPGGGNGYGCLLTGIAAPKREFAQLQDDLLRSVRSFTISQAYAQNYIQRQEGVFASIMRTGQTLRETSDIITKGWTSRQKSEDILSEKRSDATLGKERLYDPANDQVYEFDHGFYDHYNLNRNQYEMSNLQPLPDNNYNLWMTPPLNGPNNLR